MGNHSRVPDQTTFLDNTVVVEKQPPAPVSYARLSRSDRRFLDEIGSLPLIGKLSVEEERARMQAGQTTSMGDYPVEVEEYCSSACPVYLVRPRGVPGQSPVLFFLHGGGWVLGDLRTHSRIVCDLAVRTGTVVAFIDYPRAPENPFPAPLEACMRASSEVLEAAEFLRLERRRFAIGGDSSGGHLAAAFTLSAIERGLRLPSCQILLYPAADHSFSTPSYQEFGLNPNLSQFTMQWFWDNYLSDRSLNDDPRVSPVVAADDLLSRFPPTMIVTCEYDVLRDEGEQLAARLIAAGVETTAVRWLGTLHGFMVTEPLAASASAQACLGMVAQYIRDRLGTDRPD